MADDLKHIEQGIQTAMDNRALKEIYGDETINLGRKEQSSNGENSVAIGKNVTASGQFSFASGYGTEASGYSSTAEGDNTKAKGSYSHAEGYGTIANYEQHVQGTFNIEDTLSKYIHIVGNGVGGSQRSNAHTIDKKGVGWFAKDVTTDEVSIAALNSALLSTAVDITDKCSYQVTGQSLEIDVPVEGISLNTYMNRLFGGLYWGIINFSQRPPHIFIAQLSGQYRGQKDTENSIVEGFVSLINDSTFNQAQKVFGVIIHGTIDLSSVAPASGTAKLTFDMTPLQGEYSADVGTIQIFKALPVNDIMTRLAALEAKVTELSGGGGGGTNDYEQLINKPQINTVTLSGDKSLGELGAASAESFEESQEELNYVRGGYSQIKIKENMRIKDAPNGNNIGTAYVGNQYDVISATNDWIKIPYQDGYGYVQAKYTEPYGTQVLSIKELSEKVAVLEEKIQ